MRAFGLAVMMVLTGCQTTPAVDVPTPADFAALEAKKDGEVARALSPAGVVYRVRTEKHEPKADLAFWQEALARKLGGDGYIVVEQKQLTVAGQPAHVIYAVAPLDKADYGFLVAFAPLGDDILIIESAGQRAELEKVKPQILTAIGAITVR